MPKITICFKNEEPYEFNIPLVTARAVWTLLSKQKNTIKKTHSSAYNQGVADVKELLKRGYEPSNILKFSVSQIQEILNVNE